MKRILFFSENGGFQGGVERFMFQAALALRGRGVACDGVFRREAGSMGDFAKAFDRVAIGEGELALLARDADVLWVHKSSDPAVFSSLPQSLKVALYVHDHDYYCFRRHKYFPVGRINCSRAFSPLVCRLCGSISRHHDDWDRFRGNLNWARSVDCVMAGSRFMLDNLRKNYFPDEALHQLPPLVGLGEHSPIATEKIANEILFVGQLIRGKGVDLLLRAVAKLETRNWHLTIVGGGNDREFCMELMVQLKLERQVTFAGLVSDPAPYYRRAHVAVFPSRWQEPFGMTGPEALSFGVPVAGFDTGGVRDWLRDDVDGILVPERDVKRLAGAIDRLLQNPELAARYGHNGMEAMKQYTSDRFAGRLIDILEKAANE